MSPEFLFLCLEMCVCLSVHLTSNPRGMAIVFLTWEKQVRGQLPQGEAIKEEGEPGQPVARSGQKACYLYLLCVLF